MAAEIESWPQPAHSVEIAALVVAPGVADLVVVQGGVMQPGFGNVSHTVSFCSACRAMFLMMKRAVIGRAVVMQHLHQLAGLTSSSLISMVRIWASRFCSATNTLSCCGDEFPHRIRERKRAQAHGVDMVAVGFQHIQCLTHGRRGGAKINDAQLVGSAALRNTVGAPGRRQF